MTFIRFGLEEDQISAWHEMNGYIWDLDLTCGNAGNAVQNLF